MILQQHQLMEFRFDQCYSIAYNRVISNIRSLIGYFVIRLLFSSIVLIISLQQLSINIVFIIFNMIVISIDLTTTLINIYFLHCQLQNSSRKFQIAQLTNHIINDHQSLPIFCFQTSTLTNQVDQNYKNLQIKKCQRQIHRLILQNNNFIKYLQYIIHAIGIVTFIFGIVILSVSPVTPLQKSLIITIMILQFISKFIFFLILCLTPFLIIGLILFYCCKKQKKIALPQTIIMTNEIINKTDGNCSICLQPFYQNTNAIILKCSSKHVFHDWCIIGWAKIKDSCPICRTII